MADKIYQVWRPDIDGATICFASTDYNTTVDYVVSVVIDCEKKRISDLVIKSKTGEEKIAALDAQISALKSIADNDAVKSILDDLIKKQKTEITYANWRSQADTTIHKTDYYKEHLTKYCTQYKIGLFDFDTNTELDICVDDLINESAHYE